MVDMVFTNASLRRWVVCLLCTPAALLGCREETPELLIQSARTYLAHKDNKAAIIQLKTALQGKPDLAEARLLLGQALLDSGDPVSAEVELRKAVALKHSDAEVLPVLARALLHQGLVQKITEQYASTELPDPVAAANLKTSVATAYAAQGRSKQRDAALAAALQAVPGYGPALLLRAKVATQTRDFDAALRLVETVLDKTPDNHEAWQLKGDLLLFTKADVVGALEAHRKALTLAARSELVPTHASIVAILLSKRDVVGAAAQIDELGKVAPNHPQTKLLQAELAFLKQDYKAAKGHIQQVLNVAPENARALQLAGAIEFQSGSLVQAARLLGQSLQNAPAVPATRRLLVQTYLRSGQPGKALEILEPLLEKPGADAETLALAAQAQLQNGEPKKAEALFAQSAKQNPSDVRSRTALALAEFSKGRSDDGYSQLKQLAVSDPGTIADMALISAYFGQAKFEAALKAIDNLERKQTGQPLALDLRGRAHIGRNDMAAARHSFEQALALDPSYFPAAANLASLDLADKKPELAMQRFDALLKIDPKNVQALLAIASLRAQMGASNDDVGKLINNAVRLNPTALAPRMMLNDHLLRSKDAKTALAAAQAAVAAQPDSVQLLDALGRVQMAAGDFNQAIATFNKLSELRSQSPLPHLRLADVYVAMKNNDAARHSLQRALVITPELLAAKRGLVLVELAAKRPKEALAVAKSVQNAPATETIGLLLVGDVEASQKNWTAAATAYRAGLKVSVSSELAMKLYAVLVQSAQVPEADKFAAGWVKDHPQDAAFVQYLGDQAMAASDYAVAETKYLAVVKLQGENAVALNNLAWVTYKLHKPGALEYVEKANSLQPNHPAFLDTWALILGEEGQLAKAIEIEKKAVELKPLNYPFRLNLAKLYVRVGDKALAKLELDRLAKIGDEFSGQAEVSQLLKVL